MKERAMEPYYDLGWYARSITTRDPQAEVWFNRGLNWCYAFNHEEAIRCFDEVVRLDPRGERLAVSLPNQRRTGRRDPVRADQPDSKFVRHVWVFTESVPRRVARSARRPGRYDGRRI